MRSSVERHGRAYRRIVGVSLAVSAAIHAAVLGLGRVHVEMPGEQADQPRHTPVAEPVRGMQVVVLEAEAPPAPAQQARAQTQQAAAGPGDAAPTEAFATVASEAADADAAPSALPAIELRSAPTRSLAQLDTEGRVIAAGEVRATVPDVDVGGGEDDEDENENGGGLKGIIDGIGGFLGGIKVSGGIGGGGGSGGKGGCVPGIGGITGGRPKTPNIPQRPAVGPPGIGGRGPIGPMRFEHRSGTGGSGGGCSSGS
jgi:hypothetical protein